MGLKEKFIQTFKTLESRKQQWDSTYQEVYEYCMPQRNLFNETVNGAKRDNAQVVFDSTAVNGTQKFVSNIQNVLVPPMKKWARLKAGLFLKNESGQDDAEIIKQLEVMETRLFECLHASAFDQAMSEAGYDLAAGTGALLIRPGTIKQPLLVESHPISSLYIATGADNTVDTVFRKIKIQYRNIMDTWPDATIPKEMQEAYEQKPMDECELIEGMFPEEVTVTYQIDGNRRTEKIMGFKYCIMAAKGGHILVDRDEEFLPWVVFRWSVVPGEWYGRGPLLYALPDIKTLNKSIQFDLTAAALTGQPPLLVGDDGVMSLETMKLEPGIALPVHWDLGGPKMQYLNPPPYSNLQRIIVEDLRRNINEMLFTDPLGPIDAPVKTATEQTIRQQEYANRSGASFGRLFRELVAKTIDVSLKTLEKVTDPEGSPIVDLGRFRVNGLEINVQSLSPLATLQEEEEILNLMRYSRHMMEIKGPEMLETVLNTAEYARKIATHLSLPEGVVPTAEQSAQIQQNIIGLAQQQLGQQEVPEQQ